MPLSQATDEHFERLEEDLYRVEQSIKFVGQLAHCICAEQKNRRPIPNMEWVDAECASTFFDVMSMQVKTARAELINLKKEVQRC